MSISDRGVARQGRAREDLRVREGEYRMAVRVGGQEGRAREDLRVREGEYRIAVRVGGQEGRAREDLRVREDGTGVACRAASPSPSPPPPSPFSIRLLPRLPLPLLLSSLHPSSLPPFLPSPPPPRPLARTPDCRPSAARLKFGAAGKSARRHRRRAQDAPHAASVPCRSRLDVVAAAGAGAGCAAEARSAPRSDDRALVRYRMRRRRPPPEFAHPAAALGSARGILAADTGCRRRRRRPAHVSAR